MIGTVSIRAAQRKDLAEIMAIERASFPTDSWSEDAMESTLMSADAQTFVTIEGGKVVGYAAVLIPRSSRDGDVLTIAVRDASRGRGLGRGLMEALLGAVSRRRAVQLFLEVRADNDVARSLYEALGFEPIGVRERYYQPDGVDAVVMRCAVDGAKVAADGQRGGQDGQH